MAEGDVSLAVHVKRAWLGAGGSAAAQLDAVERKLSRMRIPVTLRCVAFDTQTMRPGTTRLEFFRDNTLGQANSAAAMTEPSLVKWLMADVRTRALILEGLSLPATAKSYTEVRLPFITDPNRKPGDVDLLACEVSRPDQAVAVECKRVKVRATDGAEQINRLEALGGADTQARELFRLGFSRTYLGVLAVVDGRANEERNFLFRGTSDANYRRMIEFAGGLTLPGEVGLLYIEIVQPAQRSVADAAMVCVAVPRKAKRQHQPERLTTRVENYLRE